MDIHEGIVGEFPQGAIDSARGGDVDAIEICLDFLQALKDQAEQLTPAEEAARDEFHQESYNEHKLEDIKAQHAYFKEHGVARPTNCKIEGADEWFFRGNSLSKSDDHSGLTSFIAESDYKKRVKKLRSYMIDFGIWPQVAWDVRSEFYGINGPKTIQNSSLSSWAKTILDDKLLERYREKWCV